MTNTELLAKIKAEIERRQKENFNQKGSFASGRLVEDADILSFLSTLESENPMNLDEEIDNYFKHWTEDEYTGAACHYQYVNLNDCRGIARHFAQWVADHTPLHEDTVLFNKGVAEGKRLMMEEAVEAIVEDWNPDPKPEITIPLNPEEFTCGDKVRIIIVKENEK